ncbi:Major Facilitator Superfamily protein [Amycolatopsis tolypomycina]|uniref:Major Facilitator Superfamily protein n=1 Tax=Amycolatopsis tolypomycina TaxID=208445 RepID=A0A1H4SAH4_9PSEU|nr:MFS transporter [Amycolatopsis tolypomycina]SEC41142.1 Major Facilitator Superfamily protein [Amycolatopsis tolypomycina]
MHVTPPPVTRPVAAPAWWQVSGPGFAALIGLFALTAIYRFDGGSEIQRAFDLSGQSLLLIGLVAYLVGAALTVPAGLVLGPRFPTAVAISALVALFLGVLLAAFANDGTLLLAGRAFAGLGTGAAAGTTVALITKLRERRGVVTGLTAALAVLALLLGPVVGRLISEALGFRLVQLATIPFLLAALVVNAVIGIAGLTSAKRPVPPVPNGPPYP